MATKLLTYLQGIPFEIQIMILSAIPITELRATIPLAIALGLEPIRALLYAITGNFMPILPLLFGLPAFISLMEKNKHTKAFIHWVMNRTKSKSEKIHQRYRALGLFILVSIPLPGTGIWTGSLAAILFGVPLRLAFPAITMGMITAGILVTIASVGVYNLFQYVGFSVFLVVFAAAFILFWYKRKRI